MFRITSIIIAVIFIPCAVVMGQSLDPLLRAIRNNEMSEVSKLLNNNADVKAVDEDGDNALMYAALYSTVECMQALLQKGADPNARNKRAETALIWSTHDEAKTKLLLEHKADPNIKAVSGNTAFLVACVGASQSKIIRLMLQHGADPFAVNDRRETALINVACFGDTSDARILLSRGVDINVKGRDGQSALFYAIKAVNREMVFWLLDNGADGGQLDDYKANALGYAATINDIEMVKRLIPLTKDINEGDIENMPAIMWAVYSEHDNPAIVQVMLDAGADPTIKDKKGKTVLDWALKKGNTASVELLKKSIAKKTASK